MPTSALTYFPFTYVGDENIEDFLENRSSYAYSIAFLGTSGMVVTQNNIYGVDLRNLSYVINEFSSYTEIPSAKAVNDKVQEVKTVAAEALYDMNSHIEEIETVTALALYDLNDRIDNIGDVIDIENKLGNVYSYFQDMSAYIDELDESTANALYDLNSRVETIDQVTGEALIDIYDRLESNLSYYDVAYVPAETFSKVNGNYIKALLIPIDTSINLYESGTLSNNVIQPWLSPIDKHLEIGVGGVIGQSYVVTECKLIGECMHDSLSMMNDNGTIKMWSMLPLDIALTTASKVLIKYYNE